MTPDALCPAARTLGQTPSTQPALPLPPSPGHPSGVPPPPPVPVAVPELFPMSPELLPVPELPTPELPPAPELPLEPVTVPELLPDPEPLPDAEPPDAPEEPLDEPPWSLEEDTPPPHPEAAARNKPTMLPAFQGFLMSVNLSNPYSWAVAFPFRARSRATHDRHATVWLNRARYPA